MSLRLSHLPMLMLLLVGCGNAMSSDANLAAGEDALPPPRLSIEGQADIAVLPGGMAELAVVYMSPNGEPLADQTVEFGVVTDDAATKDDYAPSASLTPIKATTDVSGRASTKLHVGTKPIEFDVRASVLDAEPVRFHVQVREARIALLTVGVGYRGLRTITSRTVTALPSMTCEKAMSAGIAGDVVHTIEAPTDQVVFQLGPGLSYAILAWGRDSAGAKLARGCQQVTAPVTADDQDAMQDVVVELDDLPLRIGSSYEVALDLDVSVSATRLSEVAGDAAQSVLPATQYREADFYLDNMDAWLRSNGKSAEADQLASKRTEGSLASSLNSALAGGMVGPGYAANELRALIAKAGARLSLTGMYGVDAKQTMSLDVKSLRARSEDSTLSVDLAALSGYAAPQCSIDASYDDSRALLVLHKLSMSYGLGTYGRALLQGLDLRDGRDLVSTLMTSAGCNETADWAQAESTLSAVCDADCALAGCKRAIAQLVSSVREAYVPLDTKHDAINLDGALFAHERTDDGIVDDLGPAKELSGDWGSSDKLDTVQGAVSTPAPTTALSL